MADGPSGLLLLNKTGTANAFQIYLCPNSREAGNVYICTVICVMRRRKDDLYLVLLLFLLLAHENFTCCSDCKSSCLVPHDMKKRAAVPFVL